MRNNELATFSPVTFKHYAVKYSKNALEIVF